MNVYVTEVPQQSGIESKKGSGGENADISLICSGGNKLFKEKEGQRDDQAVNEKVQDAQIKWDKGQVKKPEKGIGDDIPAWSEGKIEYVAFVIDINCFFVQAISGRLIGHQWGKIKFSCAAGLLPGFYSDEDHRSNEFVVFGNRAGESRNSRQDGYCKYH